MNMSIFNNIANFSEKSILSSLKYWNLINSLQKFTISRSFFLLTFHGVDFDVSIDAIVAFAKQKENGV